MSFLLFIASVLWFFLPAYAANMAPVFAMRYRWWESLNRPVDFGRHLGKERLFGSHKTIRGFAVGVLWAWLVVILQYILYERHGFFHEIAVLPYDEYNLLLLGFLFGFGALFGDLLKSFVKRRVGIGSGGKFFPFDEIDATLGVFLFVFPLVFPGWVFALTALVLNLLLHVLTNLMGYWLGIKDVWW